MPVDSHPSLFWFPERKLLLTIYVDDLMLSGPRANHASFWDALRKQVDIEDPEPLDRFLGRYHEFSSFTPGHNLDVADLSEPTVKVYIVIDDNEVFDYVAEVGTSPDSLRIAASGGVCGLVVSCNTINNASRGGIKHVGESALIPV